MKHLTFPHNHPDIPLSPTKTAAHTLKTGFPGLISSSATKSVLPSRGNGGAPPPETLGHLPLALCQKRSSLVYSIPTATEPTFFTVAVPYPLPSTITPLTETLVPFGLPR